MSTGRYELSLRVFHPREEPGVLTSIFERRPQTAWARGTARLGPDGGRLPGEHDTTYWTAHVGSGEIRDLAGALGGLATDLAGRRADIERLVDGGGRVECLVGWFEDGNSAVELPHELLHELGDIGVDLALDVYGA
ncbi:MAG TPA: hypothetical protein VM266_02125 [Solirubrobacteraceae bacterium]|nr:hypothetical protein [Solirubrobacteraceae bacterium]